MAVDCCNLSEMIGLIAHQKPVVYLSLDQRPENRNGFRFVKQRKQTAERLQQSIGNSTYPDTRSRVSFQVNIVNDFTVAKWRKVILFCHLRHNPSVLL
ncbi:Uncharacterised protein [Klebsiella pneumoniae]|nr:Uncharacterised protein [Klebsiella pneumoniae]SLR07119.1 Uncharacterised protein [Klebsiella pneumoniae]SLR10433.1 Uncharacterised protein [Klebsiella pneumoniae]SLR19380.1 Uncharacterised protein [Klebsiella pneumoniae]SLR84411.1 Uncharacterised protein [Klebsiella pneumoniae]